MDSIAPRDLTQGESPVDASGRKGVRPKQFQCSGKHLTLQVGVSEPDGRWVFILWNRAWVTCLRRRYGWSRVVVQTCRRSRHTRHRCTRRASDVASSQRQVTRPTLSLRCRFQATYRSRTGLLVAWPCCVSSTTDHWPQHCSVELQLSTHKLFNNNNNNNNVIIIIVIIAFITVKCKFCKS